MWQEKPYSVGDRVTYRPKSWLSSYATTAADGPGGIPDGARVKVLKTAAADWEKVIVEFEGRQFVVNPRCIDNGLIPVDEPDTFARLDNPDLRIYYQKVCAEYECESLGGGDFAIYYHGPGGRVLYEITDDPSLYPRRFSDRPRTTLRDGELPHMYPTYMGPVVRIRHGAAETTSLQWGFTPHWANRPIQNAQREKLPVSATWKGAFQKRRCLVPATAFFEWQARPGAGRKTKVRIRPPELPIFCFAGLWQAFKGRDGKAVDTYTIVTTTPNAFMRTIHNRMPVILDAKGQERWIDPTNTTGDGLDDLLDPYDGELVARNAD